MALVFPFGGLLHPTNIVVAQWACLLLVTSRCLDSKQALNNRYHPGDDGCAQTSSSLSSWYFDHWRKAHSNECYTLQMLCYWRFNLQPPRLSSQVILHHSNDIDTHLFIDMFNDGVNRLFFYHSIITMKAMHYLYIFTLPLHTVLPISDIVV